MDRDELMDSVRVLRRDGRTPKQIARALGVAPAVVAPLVRLVAAQDQAAAGHQIAGCWVSPGWREGLTLPDGHGWPDSDDFEEGTSGLVGVLAARDEGRGRVLVYGYLIDVYCLGVKDVDGPRTMDARLLPGFADRFFTAFQAVPLEAPLELARQLVFGAVDYARGLGFEPAPEFELAAGQLGAWAGPSVIGFGREGKPFYVQGPHDDANHVMRTLARSTGQDNFHYLVSASSS